MNLNIYLEDALAKQVAMQAKLLGETRNAIIRLAIREFLAHHQATQWPHAVQTFLGMPSFPSFEDYRSELKSPKEDPFE
ncbi:MAG: ribbon-helix-helix domain-containing protein [Gammaproteobacteria bacterium]